MSLAFTDGKTIRCADCNMELGPHTMPKDPFKAYNAGVELGRAIMDHTHRHQAENVRKGQDSGRRS